MIDICELAYVVVCCLRAPFWKVRDVVQLSGLAAKVHRALIGPLGATRPRSGLRAAIWCFAILGVIWAQDPMESRLVASLESKLREADIREKYPFRFGAYAT